MNATHHLRGTSAPLDEDPRRLLHFAHEAVRRHCPPWLASHSEDIGQALVVRLLRRRAQTRDVEITPAYVRAAARHAVVGALRKAGHRRALWEVHRPVLEQVARERSASPEHRCLLAAAREEVQRLEPQPRRAVMLYLEGDRIHDVAEQLGWNPKKADNTIFRSLAKVRERLAARGVTAAELR